MHRGTSRKPQPYPLRADFRKLQFHPATLFHRLGIFGPSTDRSRPALLPAMMIGMGDQEPGLSFRLRLQLTEFPLLAAHDAIATAQNRGRAVAPWNADDEAPFGCALLRSGLFAETGSGALIQGGEAVLSVAIASQAAREDQEWLWSLREGAASTAAHLESSGAWWRLRRIFPAWSWPLLIASMTSTEALRRWLQGVAERWDLDPSFESFGFASESLLTRDFLTELPSAQRVLLARAREGFACEQPLGSSAPHAPPGEPRSLDRALSKLSAALRALHAGDPSAEGRAKSAAEEALWLALERDARSRGRFVLNRSIATTWPSGRRLEIDLLAESCRLAIEIDGHYHFRSDDDWRRDRKKDLLLQQAGFWVARFLASDVLETLESVRDQVIALLRERDGERS